MTAKEEIHIQDLLKRYWDCQTTLAEEQELRDFFSSDHLPTSWQHYAPLFSYIRDEQSVALSEDFDERLKVAMEQEKKGNQKYITIRIFTPLLRIAASLLLIVGMGISIFFITRQNNKPWFVETYDDPHAAIKDATYALQVLSHALQTTEEASLQTIRVIDDLNINWMALDSLMAEEITADPLAALTQEEDSLDDIGEFISDHKQHEEI